MTGGGVLHASKQERAERTKAALRQAGEAIVAEGGPAALTMRAVIKQAKQRNSNAVIYHYGNAENLMWDIIQTRAHAMEAPRQVILDRIVEDRATDRIDRLLEGLAMPVIAIVDEDGYHIFARFLSQLYTHHHPYSFYVEETITDELPARSELTRLLLAQLHTLSPQRLRYLLPALFMIPFNIATAHDVDRKAGNDPPPLETLCRDSFRLVAEMLSSL